MPSEEKKRRRRKKGAIEKKRNTPTPTKIDINMDDLLSFKTDNKPSQRRGSFNVQEFHLTRIDSP